MISTTLNYKGGFKAAFAKTFKQQLPGTIVLIFLAVFASVFSAASIIVSNVRDAINNKYDITNDSILLVNYFCVICIIFSFFLAMQMFKEIYSKRACDTFFALPIKRSEYFAAKYLYGAAVNITAMLVAAVIYIVILLSASTKLVTYTIDFWAFLKISIAFLFDMLCVYTLFVFCAVLAGKKTQYFFFAIIALLAPMYITTGAIDIINKIWGADVNSFVASIIHPVQNILMLWESNIEYALSVDKYLLIILIEAVETVALYIIGYGTFKNRKAESAEFSPSGKVIPLIFLALVIAAEFSQFAAEMTYYIAIPSAIVFAVIGTMIFSGVFYKKVFVKNTVLTFTVSSAVCILFVGIVTLPGYSSYVKYVPEIDEIESAELIDGNMALMNYNSFSYYSNALSAYNFETSGPYKFTTADGIENAVKLHKKIVDDETIKKGKAINSDTWGDMMDYNYEYENSYECRIVYHLKNKRIVTRRYAVPAKMISDEMVSLMKTDEALSQIGITSIDYDDLLYAVYNNEAYEDSSSLKRDTKTLTSQELESLLRAYKEDLLNNTDKAEFLDYLSMYTGYYADIYNDRYDDVSVDVPVDTKDVNGEPTGEHWVYLTYFYPSVEDKDREYYKSLSIEELDRLSANSEKYHECIASDSIYIVPEDNQTYKYLQSIGFID